MVVVKELVVIRGVCGEVEGAEVLFSGSPLGRGVVALLSSVVLDVVEVWLSAPERLASSWLSVRFPGALVLFIGAEVVTLSPAASVEKP